MLLILAAKATLLALPFFYKRAVDAMGPGGDAVSNVALAFVLAYALGRFAGVLFDNLRNIVFERVGQDATRALAEDVFARLHRLSLRFHLARRTGEVTKVIERGTKSIDVMLYFLLFNIAPTAIELIAVAVIFYFHFGWGLVAATAVAVVAYAVVTRWITEWRTALRETDEPARRAGAVARGQFAAQLRDREVFQRRSARGSALCPGDPRLCQGGGEKRELARPAQHRPGADRQPADGGRDGLYRVGLVEGRTTPWATWCSSTPTSPSCSARSTCSAWSIARSARG